MSYPLLDDHSKNGNSSKYSNKTVLFIKTLFGQTFQFQVNFSTATIQHIKQLVQKRTGIKTISIRLFSKGIELADNQATLQSLRINPDDNIYMVIRPSQTLPQQTISIQQSVFQPIGLAQEEQKAPIKKKVMKSVNKFQNGLNLELTCTNSTCSQHNQTVYCGKGFGDLNIGKQIFFGACPYCQTKVEMAHNFGFFNCKYTIQAKRDSEKKGFVVQDIVNDGRYYRFLNGNQNYQQMNYAQAKVSQL